MSVWPAFMSFPLFPVRAGLIALSLAGAAYAQSLLPAERVPLDSLAAFRLCSLAR